VSSKKPSEPLPLERDLPATAEDVAVLRKLRQPPLVNLLPRMNELAVSRYFPAAAESRKTSEDWEPFRAPGCEEGGLRKKS
jgi:hypothetical protein